MIKSIEINGYKIEYLDIGRGKPLLFLHGAFGSFRFYRQLLDKLSKRYRVLAPSLPSMGRSTSLKSKGDMIEEQMICIKEFISKLIGPSKFILLGHSLGAYLSLRLNLKYKLNNSDLILLNPPAYSFPHYILTTIKGWSGLILRQFKNIRKLKHNQIIPIDAVNIVFLRPVQFLRIFKHLSKIEKITNNQFINKKINLSIFTSKDDNYVKSEHALYLNDLFPASKLHIIEQGGHAWFNYDDKQLLKLLNSISLT